MLAEGMRAPAFRLPDSEGNPVALKQFAGRRLVLFFFPRADTAGCTLEAQDFSRLMPEFGRSGTDVVGISADPAKAQAKFRTKRGLVVPLLSDEPHRTLEAYGVWGKKKLYGREFDGIFRTTVLIDSEGRIAKIWHNVKVDGHAAEVLAAARSLAS